MEFVESENDLETTNDAVVNSYADSPVVTTPNKFPAVLRDNKTHVEDQELSKISKPQSTNTGDSGEPGELIIVTQVISYNLDFTVISKGNGKWTNCSTSLTILNILREKGMLYTVHNNYHS